jgi:predicted site-specific integrase-resolvase
MAMPITTTDAAEELGISVQLVARYCAQGRLKAEQRSDGRWMILRSNLDKFKRKSRKRGNPNFGKQSNGKT